MEETPVVDTLEGRCAGQQFSTFRLQPLWGHISDGHIMNHNSSKLHLFNRNKIILRLGVTTAEGAVLKGYGFRKVENHVLENQNPMV